MFCCCGSDCLIMCFIRGLVEEVKVVVVVVCFLFVCFVLFLLLCMFVVVAVVVWGESDENFVRKKCGCMFA